MKKRVLLILTVLGVLALVVGGICAYVRRGTGAPLLKRAELAVRAGNYSEAAELAQKYIDEDPSKWAGYHWKAVALIRQGQYEPARALLEAVDARTDVNVDKVELKVLLAETSSHPARRALATRNLIQDVAKLDAQVVLLEQANKRLDEALKLEEAREDKGASQEAELHEAIGTNHWHIAGALDFEARLFRSQAETARAARNEGEAVKKEEDAVEAEGKRDDNEAKAAESLLAAVRNDLSRSDAAGRLVSIALRRREKDPETLLETCKAILPALLLPDAHTDKDRLLREQLEASPCPQAAMGLVADPRLMRGGASQQGVEKAIKDLDVLIGKHPHLAELKIRRAQLAFDLRRYAEALASCDEVLKENPRHAEARLLRGQVLAALGNMVEAKRVLFELKTERADSPRDGDRTGVAYARAVLASSAAAAARGDMDLARQERELAIQEMRRVVSGSRRVERSQEQALAFLAESLLADGFADQAYQDARRLYEARPDLPQAVDLYVRTALATDQPTLADDALEKAEKDHGDDAFMLEVVAKGYETIGKSDKAKTVRGGIAACTPATLGQCHAVAKSLVNLGRYVEAEALLLQWLDPARSVPDAVLSALLGELYMVTGRPYHATERFQFALDREPNRHYRTSLAAAMIESGRLEEAEGVLEAAGAGDEQADLLRYRIRVIRGDGGADLALPDSVQDKIRGPLGLAVGHLRAGRFDQCIAVCQAELKKTPDQFDLRSLLAQALLQSGRRDQAIGEFKTLVAQAPGRAGTYFQLATIVAPDGDVSKLRAALADVASARADLMAMACGQFLENRGRFEEAAKVYRAAVAAAASQPPLRNQARMFLSRALASAGKLDEALAELDLLGREKDWTQAVTIERVVLLAGARRMDEVRPVLDQLKQMALKGDVGPAALGRIALLLRSAGAYELALDLCKALQHSYPAAPELVLVESVLLRDLQRSGEAVDLLEGLVARQPYYAAAYLALAGVHEEMGQAAEAVATLDRLAKLGQAAKVQALADKGRMLANWGLQDRAIACFEEIGKLEARTPRIDLDLGRALAALGRREEAVKVFGGIPAYSPFYVAAQRFIAQVSEPLDAQLAVLDELDKRVPGRPEAMDLRMRLLMDNGRSGEAVGACLAFAQRAGADRTVPAPLVRLAIEAMIHSGDRPAAVALAGETFRRTGDAQWRTAQVVLRGVTDPAGVQDDLPALAQADLPQTLIAVSAAARTGQADRLKQCLSRLETLRQQLQQARPPRALLPTYEFLLALTTGEVEKARAMSAVDGLGAILRTQLREQVEHVAKGPPGREELARLVAVTVANEMGYQWLAGEEAMAILKARPSCQLAAAMAHGFRPDLAEQVANLLRPEDCLLAARIKASLLIQRKEYVEAAEMLAGALAKAGGDLELVKARAIALDFAGRGDEAMKLYRQAWDASGDPPAGNSAAYLMAVLKGDDPAVLREAADIAEKALQRSRGDAACRDTLGWICLLRGDLERARTELRAAVKGLPELPEVHYHLGMAEKKSGQTLLARWHLEAAVAHNTARAAKGVNTKSSDEAAAAAGKALAEISAGAP